MLVSFCMLWIYYFQYIRWDYTYTKWHFSKFTKCQLAKLRYGNLRKIVQYEDNLRTIWGQYKDNLRTIWGQYEDNGGTFLATALRLMTTWWRFWASYRSTVWNISWSGTPKVLILSMAIPISSICLKDIVGGLAYFFSGMVPGFKALTNLL